MSKHVLGSLKFSGGILSLYCLSLAIVPTAYSQNISNATGGNVSQASGFQSASFNSFAPASASIGAGGSGGTASAGGTGDAGTVATGDTGTGAKSNTIFGTNRQANVRNAQALQSQLDAAQTSYDSASARVAQLLAASQTPPAPDNAKSSAVRFALKPSPEGSCGCNNPDVAVQPVDNSGAEAAKELAAAKDAQAQAQAALDDAKGRARLFLASADKAPEASAQNSSFSPVW
jgi:hypothetical protein